MDSRKERIYCPHYKHYFPISILCGSLFQFLCNGVFGLPSSNTGKTHPHATISEESVIREVEAEQSSVVKNVQITTKHAVALAE
jgi:hypothetical protein